MLGGSGDAGMQGGWEAHKQNSACYYIFYKTLLKTKKSQNTLGTSDH